MFKSVVAVVVLLALVAGGVYILGTGGMSRPEQDAAPASGGEASVEFVLPVITSQEAYSRWRAEPARTVLLDVRTDEEYARWNIPGALHVPVADSDFGEQVANRIPDRNTEIFLFCRTGRRTGPAAEILRRFGYEKLYNMGGIIDWPFETAGSDS